VFIREDIKHELAGKTAVRGSSAVASFGNVIFEGEIEFKIELRE
jgi:hypothetical protein